MTRQHLSCLDLRDLRWQDAQHPQPDAAESTIAVL